MKLLIWNLKILVGSSRNLAKHWEVEAKFSTCLYESLHITEISKCVSGIFDFNNWNAEQEEWRAYYGERGAINLERGVQEFWREGYRSSGERGTGVLERGVQEFWREGYRNAGERGTGVLERGAQEFWREGHRNFGERGTGILERGPGILERGVHEFWREGHRSSGERGTWILERGAQEHWIEGYTNCSTGTLMNLSN